MPHQIITRRKDGTEGSRSETLSIPDLVRHITIELSAMTTAEVVVRPITITEARSLDALREVLGRLQSPAALEAARLVYIEIETAHAAAAAKRGNTP